MKPHYWIYCACCFLWVLGCKTSDETNPKDTERETGTESDSGVSNDTASDLDETGTDSDIEVGSDSEADCPIGMDGCPCSAAATCNPGLTCLSDVCVFPGSDGDVDADTDTDTDTDTDADSCGDADRDGERDVESMDIDWDTTPDVDEI